MAIEWNELLPPSQTAILVIEMQEGVIGQGTYFRDLADNVRASGMLPRLASLLSTARRAGVKVIYCPADRRADGLGNLRNTPLTAKVGASRAPPEEKAQHAKIVSEIAPQPGDAIMPNAYGMTCFHDSGLDTVLRGLGARTVVPTGVSLNIAILGATLDAVNRGYRVVIPADCVAGTPSAYGEQVLQHTLRNLAYITTADQIGKAWRKG